MLECCLSHDRRSRYACKSKSLLLLQHSADCCAAVYGVGISLQCCSEGCLRMSAYVPSTGYRVANFLDLDYRVGQSGCSKILFSVNESLRNKMITILLAKIHICLIYFPRFS